jgi:hypothetical protein
VRPYYISAAKVSFLVANGGARRRSVETTITKVKGKAALNPSVEGGLDHQLVESEPDLADPYVALGQLSTATALLEDELVEPTDATLAVGEWFRLVGEAEYGILSRDSGDRNDPIATWFMEVPYPDLGVAYWTVLTGSVGHLREEWTGRDHRNRSGSGTGAVFDVLAQVSGQDVSARDVHVRERFRAVSSMMGLAPTVHPIHTVAEVKHIWATDDSGFSTASGLPIVRVIVASPLFVEPHRVPRVLEPNARAAADAEQRRFGWRRFPEWLGF